MHSFNEKTNEKPLIVCRLLAIYRFLEKTKLFSQHKHYSYLMFTKKVCDSKHELVYAKFANYPIWLKK